MTDFFNFFAKINANQLAINLKNLQKEIDTIISQIGQNQYENKFVIDILSNSTFKPLLDSIYNDLRLHKICLVSNIADGVGHWVAELDYFFRKKHLKEIDANYFFLIRKPNHLAKACLDYYGWQFDYSCCNLKLYNLMLPISMHYHDVTFDAGLSRLRWQIPKENYVPIDNGGQGYVHQINKRENREDWEDYYRVRSQSVDFWPLKINSTKEEVEDILKTKFEKIAIIHIKNVACNSSAKIIEPHTYIPTIQYLNSQNYKVVFAGRETMPHSYRNLNVINYSESPNASFSNDFKIFAQASNSIICASGVSLLSEVLEIPLIYFNHWHIARVPFPKKSICVPALVKEKTTGRILSFLEEIELYNNRPDIGPELFPSSTHIPINADADDILQSAMEMEDLIKNYKPMNTLQAKFNKVHNEGQIVDTQSRISNHFVTKYQNLL